MITAGTFTFIFAMFVSGYADFSDIPVFVCCAILCLIFSQSVKKTFRQNIFSALICIVLFLFAISEYSFFLNRINDSADKFLSKNKETIIGTVLNDISSYSDSGDFYIKSDNGNIIRVKLKSLHEVYPGDIVKIENAHVYKVPSENSMKNFNRRLFGKKCVLFLKTKSENFSVIGFDKKYTIISGAYKLKKNTFYELMKYLDYDDASLAYTMFTSDREFLPQGIIDSLIRTGTIHIATVSGLHFVLIAGIVMTLLRLFVTSYRKRICIILFFMTIFAIYTGLGVSVVRAYISLAVIYVADLIRERRMNLKDIVLLTMSAFLIISPMYVYDISFILTFCATVGIAFFSIPIQSWYGKNYDNKFGIPITSIVVTLVMLPFVFGIFGRVSVVSVAANYFVDFAIGPILILVIFTAIFSIIFSPIAVIGAFFLKILMKYFLLIIRLFSKIENINLQMPLNVLSALLIIICITSAIYLFIKKEKRVRIKTVSILITGLLCFLFYYIPPLFEERAAITFFGYDSCESVAMSKNAHHIVVGSASDFYYYAASSALRQNESVDLWVITEKADKELTDEITKNYKIKEIVAPVSAIDGEKVDYIDYFSENELKRNIKDMNISIKFDYDRLIYTEIEYGNNKLYISDSDDFIDEYLENLSNCSVLFTASQNDSHKEFLEYVDIPDTIELYSAAEYDLKYHQLSPYSIGLFTKEGVSFN